MEGCTKNNKKQAQILRFRFVIKIHLAPPVGQSLRKQTYSGITNPRDIFSLQ